MLPWPLLLLVPGRRPLLMLLRMLRGLAVVPGLEPLRMLRGLAAVRRARA